MATGLAISRSSSRPTRMRVTKSVYGLAFFTLVCGQSLGADKSGVGPNTISLPKGPGSIEGLGESFQPTLNTGTAKHNIPLKLPPGTAGHAPELSLAYESGGGNGPLGFGWGLSLPYIQRRTDHGIPTYGTNAPFSRDDTFINEMKEELVPLSNGFWFCKNEGAFHSLSASNQPLGRSHATWHRPGVRPNRRRAGRRNQRLRRARFLLVAGTRDRHSRKRHPVFLYKLSERQRPEPEVSLGCRLWPRGAAMEQLSFSVPGIRRPS